MAELPPGPTPLPIIGNLLDFPKDKPWETYGRLQQKYGDLVRLTGIGEDLIILNSWKAAIDLLEQRSAIYSGRPHFIMIHELLDYGPMLTFLPYGNTWRKVRTIWNRQFHPTVIPKFHEPQRRAAFRTLQLLAKDPKDFREHLRNYSAGIITEFAYGHELQTKNDPILKLLLSSLEVFTQAATPGAFLVDTIPWLKHIPSWVPGTGFKQFAKESNKVLNEVRDMPFQMVKQQLASGTAHPSFVACALQDLGTDDESNLEVVLIKQSAMDMIAAGTDTTATSIVVFVLAMVLYPAAMRKAQKELDTVIGFGKVPEFEDRSRLPYCDAILKEVLRWYPIVPGGIPHLNTEDDIYAGYRIPAKSILVANAWAFLHDAELYPEPYEFKPERFLPDKDGNAAKDPATTGTFGFGRRICPGKNLADASLWLAVVSLLATFDITEAITEQGEKIKVDYARNPLGLTLCEPPPFPCRFIPRSKEIEASLSAERLP